MKYSVLILALTASALSFGQSPDEIVGLPEAGPAETPPTPKTSTPVNPLAPNDQMLDLKDSLKLVSVMDFRYIPSQRDPFISHEIISPFVTEEEVEEELMEEQKLVTQEEVQAFLEKYIQVYGISTGKTGGGYALAAVAVPQTEGAEASFRQRILKPGTDVRVPLDAEALAKFGESFLFWDWITTSGPTLELTTIQVHEAHMHVPRDSEGHPILGEITQGEAVELRINPVKDKRSKSPFSSIFIPNQKHYQKEVSQTENSSPKQEFQFPDKPEAEGFIQK